MAQRSAAQATTDYNVNSKRSDKKGEISEHQLHEAREGKEEKHPYHIHHARDMRMKESMQLGLSREQRTSAPFPPQIPDLESSDDSETDSDDEKRQDPYKLLGFEDRDRTTVQDINITQQTLRDIHHATVKNSTSAAKIKNAEKRLVEMQWASNILLDEINRRAYDEDGAIYEREQVAWRKKSKLLKICDCDGVVSYE
jgi:hypothetical protein